MESQFFADYIVAPNSDKIDFSGFELLLDRIVATMTDHARRIAAGLI
jgi:hypothetical protein